MADKAAAKTAPLETEVQGLRLKEEADDDDSDNIQVADVTIKRETPPLASASGLNTSTNPSIKKLSRSPMKVESAMASPAIESEHEDTVGGDVTVKQEPGKPPKLTRTTSHKIERRPPPLFLDWEDKTAEATSTFAVLNECVYANKHLGTTDPALECDCAEEWDASTRDNNACGEDSDCINRATKMECASDCGCGNGCQNQRFTRKQYADVSVIKTEKKGYGLRANVDLMPNDFIFEYIGEVIGEGPFRKRMQLYDAEGIKHFYFMSLTKGEFVDATKKGNLGRFCNHSCNPNCYVDKWVVGDKLRMGLFAERKVKAGEELVFNYNVDRYGAEPQPCYCGEPNCTGFIGGKTQTERATKLSKATIEALGIDDADGWDTAVAKKPRKKKSGEDDEEYVNNVEPRELDETGVRAVMSQLPQCKERWIAVKLLDRIQRADDPNVIHQVVRMHGYRHLKTALGNFLEDVNICLQILDVLNKLPRITRNKVQDSKIEDAVQLLISNEDERVVTQAKALLEAWSKLEIGYRIPRVKRDPNAIAQDRKFERVDRRDNDRRRSRSRSHTRSPERVNAPTGPRGAGSQRGYHSGPRPSVRFRPPPPSGPLPAGWFEAVAPNGSTYYYNQAGNTSWQRPTKPAAPAPPPPPPKAISDQQMLQDLIKNIVAAKKEPTQIQSESATPVDTPKKEKKADKWKSLSEDKQKKIYESTLQPHVMHVVNKFKHKMEKDDLKRLAKEVSKKIVNTDFKSKRVENPSKISDKHAKSVKKYAHETFEKAVKKKAEHDKRKAEKKAKHEESQTPGNDEGLIKIEDEPTFSDDEGDEPLATPADISDSPSSLKRPREEDLLSGDVDESVIKKLRADADISDAAPPPPPPPPPPPAGGLSDDAMDVEPHEGSADQVFAGSNDSNSGVFYIHAKPGMVMNKDVLMSQSEPTQTATPPTTGSPDLEETEDSIKREESEGGKSDLAPS